MRTRLKAGGAGSRGAWARYFLGRLLQVTGLLVALVAATAFFGTPSTTAMLRDDAGRGAALRARLGWPARTRAAEWLLAAGRGA